MKIEKVKLQDNGYLVNDSLFVPNDKENRHYKDIEEWLKNNEVLPGYTDEELLDNAKSNKKQELETKFNEVSLEPVIVNGITYYGGYESSQKLDDKRRLTIEGGGTEVRFFDINRDYHSHTLKEALDVCIAIATKYETDLEHYNTKLKEVDSKLKVDTVKAITW